MTDLESVKKVILFKSICFKIDFTNKVVIKAIINIGVQIIFNQVT